MARLIMMVIAAGLMCLAGCKSVGRGSNSETLSDQYEQSGTLYQLYGGAEQSICLRQCKLISHAGQNCDADPSVPDLAAGEKDIVLQLNDLHPLGEYITPYIRDDSAAIGELAAILRERASLEDRFIPLADNAEAISRKIDEIRDDKVVYHPQPHELAIMKRAFQRPKTKFKVLRGTRDFRQNSKSIELKGECRIHLSVTGAVAEKTAKALFGDGLEILGVVDVLAGYDYDDMDYTMTFEYRLNSKNYDFYLWSEDCGTAGWNQDNWRDLLNNGPLRGVVSVTGPSDALCTGP